MKNQYTIHELMTLFADGELSESEEQFLFDAIASYPELQAEFKQTLLVHKLLLETTLPIPSEECDAQLFAKAGFGEKKKKRGLIFFLNRPRTYISVAAALLCIIGTYSWYFTPNNSSVKAVQANTIISNNNAQRQNDYGVKPEIGTTQLAHAGLVQTKKSLFRNASHVNQNSLSVMDDETSATMTIAADDGANTIQSIVKKENVSAQNHVPVPFDMLSQKQALSQLSPSVVANNRPHQHTVEISRNFSSKYFVEARGAMSMNATTPNISVAGMMKLQDKTWIGLAAGRDNMVNTGNNASTVQEGDLFGTSLSKGALVETEIPKESIPTIQHWVGAVVEHRLGTITEGIEPTTRLTLGGAESGPFGKIGVGVMMRFTPQFIGTIGIENTGLVYKSTIDNSWKSVVTFGGLCSFAIEF